jgi:glycosyltransferase involved in cell wall biosynthesis
VNDGSRDATGQVLDRATGQWIGEGRRMVVVHQPHAGAAAARNTGLTRATGSFICFFDADDRLAPKAIERLAAALRANSDMVLAAPLWRYIDEAGVATGIVSDPRGLRHDAAGLVVRGPLHSATGVLVRADAAREAGAFDTHLRGCIDLDWFVRLVADRGEAAMIVPEVLADYRKRTGQITGDWRRMQTNWERVIQKMAEAGHGLSAEQERRARARNQVYWATLAYQAGEYAAARRLLTESWRSDPRAAWRDPLARLRTLAALASLLPRPLHAALRARIGSRA